MSVPRTHSLITTGHAPLPADHEPPGLSASPDTFDFRWLLVAFRRRLWTFSLVAGLVMAGVAVYLLGATPVYTGQAEVMLDSREMQVVPTAQAMVTGVQDDSGVVDTQVEAVQSRQVAERVVSALKLDQDPEFNAALREPGPVAILKARVMAIFGAGADEKASAAVQHRDVIDTVLGDVVAKRVGATYAITIGFTSQDPDKAARIANQFAQSYLQDQFDAQASATRRANDFLNSRLGALQAQAQNDAAAVARYKIAHNLLSTTGATLTEQELSNYNQQLVTAEAEAAADQARLRTAREQLAHGSTGDDVGEAIESSVVGQLRTQRAQVSGQLAQLQSRYGPKHPEILKMEGQLKDIDLQIQGEINRIISNLEAKTKVSSQRLASMRGSLDHTRGVLADNNAALVQLTALQQTAAASEALYDSYLARFKETGAQEGVEQSRSRVISEAHTPSEPSAPKTKLLLALGLVLGAAAGLAAIIIRETLDPALASAEDVERRLGIPYVGAVPLLSSTDHARLSAADTILRRPRSAFSEAFRGVRATLDHLGAPGGGPGRSTVTVITSALPGEGKTVTAFCLGRSAALAGIRTVVVDCDLRQAGIQKLIKVRRDADLMSVLAGADLDDALVWEPESGLAVLPVNMSESVSTDLLVGQAMDRLLADLRRRFHVIILDSAPVLPVAESRVLAAKADVTLFLAGWRKTPDHVIRSAFRLLASAGAEVSGVVLTKMDMRYQSRMGYGDAAQYFKTYKRYYAG
ncbi:MAG TPA: polysaccharide biosynthesis tyrosine autokinase [Caulobacteraceae bacterium]